MYVEEGEFMYWISGKTDKMFRCWWTDGQKDAISTHEGKGKVKVNPKTGHEVPEVEV